MCVILLYYTMISRYLKSMNFPPSPFPPLPSLCLGQNHNSRVSDNEKKDCVALGNVSAKTFCISNLNDVTLTTLLTVDSFCNNI